MTKENPQERAARLKAAREVQQRAERKRNILMVAAVVLVMVAIVGGGFAISKLTSSSPKDSEAASAVGSVTIGPDSAPHKVIIYEDFLCPYCGELERTSGEKLAALADAGKVQVTYRPFNLLQTDYSQQSLEVFQALAHDSTPEITKKFHDLAYANQPSESGPFPSQDDLVALAVQAGGSQADIEAALKGSAPQWANEATAAASKAGVQSTPTVLLDGSEFTATTVDDLVSKLLKAIG
jgi:protein-disulfide isomerase